MGGPSIFCNRHRGAPRGGLGTVCMYVKRAMQPRKVYCGRRGGRERRARELLGQGMSSLQWSQMGMQRDLVVLHRCGRWLRSTAQWLRWPARKRDGDHSGALGWAAFGMRRNQLQMRDCCDGAQMEMPLLQSRWQKKPASALKLVRQGESWEADSSWLAHVHRHMICRRKNKAVDDQIGGRAADVQRRTGTNQGSGGTWTSRARKAKAP